MKKMLVICMLLAALAGNVFAEGLDVDLVVTGKSKYIWRGHTKTNDPVLQPEVNVKLDKLTFTAWGNLETTNVNGEEWNFTETDLILDFTDSSPIKGINYSLGVIRYDYPQGDSDDSTWEVYGGLSIPDLVLSPSIKMFYDIDGVRDGMYFLAGVKQEILAPPADAEEGWISLPQGIVGSATVGWGNSEYNAHYWGLNSTNMNDLVLSAAVPVKILGITVAPTVSYIKLLDDIDGGAENDDIVIGLTLLTRKF